MKRKSQGTENTWVVQIYEESAVKKKSFETETEAIAWSANFAREINIKAGSDFTNLTFGDLLDRYGKEVAPLKAPANYRATLRKIKFFKNTINTKTNQNKYSITSVNLNELSKNDFIKFRDKRLMEVAEGTFLREWSLFFSAMSIAVGEWGWIHKNCMKGIRKPSEPAPRSRRITEEEIKLITQKLEYDKDSIITTLKQRAAICFLFAIETGMRASEITNLKRSEVFLSEGYVKVSGEELMARKTKSSIRSVPLTIRAKDLIQQIYNSPNFGTFIFGIEYQKMNREFYKAKQRARVFDLKFHDTRHEAISRLAKIFSALDLARIVGHHDIHSLMVYYNPTIEELVSKLEPNQK